MPVIAPPLEGNIKKMLDRLRYLLDHDTTLHISGPGGGDLYQGSVRAFPPDSITEEDSVVVSLHAGADDFERATLGPAGTARMTVAPMAVLSVLVYEGEGGDAVATHNRVLSVTSAVKWALLTYERDPTPGDALWQSLTFKQRFTTQYGRKPNEFQDSRTLFELSQQAKVNC